MMRINYRALAAAVAYTLGESAEHHVDLDQLETKLHNRNIRNTARAVERVNFWYIRLI